MLCHVFTRNIQNIEKTHCLVQSKVNIWSYGRGTVTVLQYASEGKESTEKVRYLFIIVTSARFYLLVRRLKGCII